VAKRGFKAAAIRPCFWNGRYPTLPEFDPLWREFEDLGVVLAMHTRAGSSAARPVDVLLSLAGVLSFVFSNVVYKRMRTRPHPVVLNAAQLLCAGLALVPAALLIEGPPHIQWTAPLLISLAYLVASIFLYRFVEIRARVTGELALA